MDIYSYHIQFPLDIPWTIPSGSEISLEQIPPEKLPPIGPEQTSG